MGAFRVGAFKEESLLQPLLLWYKQTLAVYRDTLGCLFILALVEAHLACSDWSFGAVIVVIIMLLHSACRTLPRCELSDLVR